jgi:hypothetical protein
MIKPLTRIIGKKPIKIKALTKIIPVRKVKEELKNFASMFIPIIPPWMLEFEDERQYLVPKSLFNVLVEDRDVDDWNYLLERFNNLLANLSKLLNNIRKIDYHKIVSDKLLEQEISTRKIKITEKLLEKESEKEYKKNQKTPVDEKIRSLTEVLIGVGAITAAGNRNPFVDPLDAATIADAKASGADLIAAAHLATLEASSPQHAADVFQVILNRAKGQSGGVIAVITAQEQFTPYSAAIYGASIDKNAERVYGHLGVTKKEIVDIAKTQGLAGLVQRFGGYGSVSVAEQVLQDFKSKGPLSQSSANFVGGAQYFMGYATNLPGERRRPDGGNYFRDNYSSGAIHLPDLLDYHYIQYDTTDPTSDISKFIVDKPTIIDTQKVGEPLVIIPTGRPIGNTILNMLFREPFRKIDQIFERSAKEIDSKVKAQTPIKNNTTSINRTTIPQSLKSESKPQNSLQKTAPDLYSILYPEETAGSILDFDIPDEGMSESASTFAGLTLPPPSSFSKKTNIDIVSQKTGSIFGPKVILMTQDIYATEE